MPLARPPLRPCSPPTSCPHPASRCADDNELLALEIIHQFVEVLDKYFGNVCELDLIFNFHKAYFILDELLLAGELQVWVGGGRMGGWG